MSKLNENGILTDEAIELIHREWWMKNIAEIRNIESLTLSALTRGANKERDALLELFESWVDEADDINKRNHYSDGSQDGINYLNGQLAALRDKEKPPGG